MTVNMPKSIARARSRSIAVSTSKSFGPAKNFSGASARCGSIENEIRSRARVLRAGRRRNRDRRVRDLDRARQQRRRHEVVVVDAGVVEVAFVGRLLGDVLRRQAHDLAALEQDALRPS